MEEKARSGQKNFIKASVLPLYEKLGQVTYTSYTSCLYVAKKKLRTKFFHEGFGAAIIRKARAGDVYVFDLYVAIIRHSKSLGRWLVLYVLYVAIIYVLYRALIRRVKSMMLLLLRSFNGMIMITGTITIAIIHYCDYDH